MKHYEWAVIGSGIAGLSIAEILAREGHSVILVEKNNSLASETTREFHEWLHTGALYTLLPDRLRTLKFILGAIDDLLEYYSSYERMNLIPSEEGLKIDDSFSGWFDKNYIHFKYRIKNRKIMLPWIIGVARSIYLIEKIHQHDWLRRRAGELEPFKIGRLKRIISIIKNILISKDIFMDVTTPDLTINSRLLLRDMVATAVKNGLDISLNNEVKRIDKNNNIKSVIGNKETIYAENVAICNGSGIKKFTDVKTKLSYAPISVVDGISEGSDSFVELDFFPQNCINLLTKKKGIGLAGGISMFDKSKCDDYLDRVISKHKLYNNNINEIYRYVGLKTEITFKNEPRGYLYNIVKTDDKIWAIVPGKFTLAFSMAPEFYRRIYNRNPRKYFKTITCDNKKYNVSNTVWEDMLNNKGQEHGIN